MKIEFDFLNLKNNISISIVFQALAMLFVFLQVPISLNYLGDNSYGIWITYFNLILLFASFDFGISNGIRNELAKAFSLKDKSLINSILSNALFFQFSFSILFLFVGLLVNHIYFTSNIISNNSLQIYQLIIIILIGFSVDYFFRIAQVINTSFQKAFITPFIFALNNLMTFMAIFILHKYNVVFFEDRLLTIAVFFSFIPFVNNLCLFLYSFLKTFNIYKLSINLIDKKVLLHVSKKGIGFFYIQIGMFLFLQLNNFYILNWISPVEVSRLSIADKYFGLITVFGSVILFPLWSKFTQKDQQKDYKWIKNIYKKIDYIFIIVFVLGLIQLLFFNFFKNIWIGDKLDIEFHLLFLILTKHIFTLYNSSYCYYLNGTNNLSLQIKLYFLLGIINFPISYFLVKELGLVGILILPNIGLIIMSYFMRKQVFKIIYSN